MDEYEYLDHFFYSPTWSDIDLKQRSSDFRSEFDHPNGLLLGSDRINEDDSNSRTSMINSNGSTESLAAQDASSVVVGSESDYGVNMALHSAEAQLQEEMVNGGNSVEVTNLSAGSSLLPFPEEVGHMQCNAFEPSDFQSLRSDFQTLPQIPHLSPLPSFEGVSSLSPGLGQDTIGGFGFRGGEYIDNDLYAVESHSSNLSASLSSKVVTHVFVEFLAERSSTKPSTVMMSLSVNLVHTFYVANTGFTFLFDMKHRVHLACQIILYLLLRPVPRR